MDYLTCAFEFKADTDNIRTFVGYGAVFGNKDSYGDTIAKGAFVKTLATAKSGATAYLRDVTSAPAMILRKGERRWACG
jgi:hypothetical protein